MKPRKIKAIDIFISFCVLAILLNCYWFLTVGPPLKAEAPLRMALGSFIIFILPGLIYGEVFKFRSRHVLETLALSFAITLCIDIVLLPIPFLLGGKIVLWVGLLLGSCLVGLFLLYVRSRKVLEFNFLEPLLGTPRRPYPLQISTLVILLILVITAFGAYRWGEDFSDISGEKLLHLVYVRYYYSMPLVLTDLGIYPGQPPPNLVNLWEYLIAGWASLINMDPLPLFNRSRFVLPILGFSSMYLLIRNFFTEDVKVEIVFWGVLIMSLGGVMLLSPSNLDWVKMVDPYRKVMSFMGTCHRSDMAMEILIALNAGLFLMNMKSNATMKTLLLLAGVLVATFMWHPREFFQTAMLAGIWGIAVLAIRQPDKKIELKKWVVIMGIFFIVAVTMFLLMQAFTSQDFSGYNEFALKKKALSYAFSWDNMLGVRNLFIRCSECNLHERTTSGLHRK